MCKKLKQLEQWVVEKQNSLPHGEMTETQSTIFCTLQLIRNQINFLKSEKKQDKNNHNQSPGYYGC